MQFSRIETICRNFLCLYSWCRFSPVRNVGAGDSAPVCGRFLDPGRRQSVPTSAGPRPVPCREPMGESSKTALRGSKASTKNCVLPSPPRGRPFQTSAIRSGHLPRKYPLGAGKTRESGAVCERPCYRCPLVESCDCAIW